MFLVKTSKDFKNWTVSFAHEVTSSPQTYVLRGRSADLRGLHPLEDKTISKGNLYVRIYKRT